MTVSRVARDAPGADIRPPTPCKASKRHRRFRQIFDRQRAANILMGRGRGGHDHHRRGRPSALLRPRRGERDQRSRHRSMPAPPLASPLHPGGQQYGGTRHRRRHRHRHPCTAGERDGRVGATTPDRQRRGNTLMAVTGPDTNIAVADGVNDTSMAATPPATPGKRHRVLCHTTFWRDRHPGDNNTRVTPPAAASAPTAVLHRERMAGPATTP